MNDKQADGTSSSICGGIGKASYSPAKWKILVLCLLSALGNVMLSYAVNGLSGIPLYLDTVFTAAMCFCAGIVPAILAGVLFPPLLTVIKYKYLLDLPVETGLMVNFFSLCVLLEIFLVYFFYKKIKSREDVFLSKIARKEPLLHSFIGVATQLLVLAAIDCIAISIMGGIIDFATSLFSAPRAFYPEDTFKLGLLRNNMPILAANILSRIPINIVDRFIVVFGGYGTSLLYRKWLVAKN